MPINFSKPAGSLVDAARRNSDRLFAALERSPRLTVGAASAALVAPLLLKNDQRGYVETSMITTPLIAAGAMVAPRFYSAGMRELSRFKVMGRQAADRIVAAKGITYDDIVNYGKSYAQKSMSLEQYEAMLGNYYAGAGRDVADLGREGESLKSLYGSMFLDPEKQSMIANALHAERLRTSSAAELSGMHLSAIAETPENPFQMTQTILGQIESGNVDFIRGMQGRLQKIRNLKDPGGSIVNQNPFQDHFKALSYTESDVARTLLEQHRPDLMKELLGAAKRRAVDLDNVEVLIPAAGRPYNPILGLRINHDLTVPVVGPNGTVALGNEFDRVGVSRLFYNSQDVMKSDVYALRHLEFGPQKIREELARANIVGAMATDDDFATFTNPAFGEYATSSGSVALRSRQAIPSELTGFAGRPFGALDPEEREAAGIAMAQKHGFTKVGAESGAAKHIYELGETENLALFGLTNVERQNKVWRAITKPVSLAGIPEYDPTANIPERLTPFSRTDYLQKVAPGVRDNSFALHVAGISPHQKTLFGDLPEDVASLSDPKVVDKAISAIVADSGLNHNEAKEAWMEIARYVSDPKNLQAMRKTGYLGEGGYLGPQGLHGLNVETSSVYKVHEMRVGDWQSLIGTSVDSNTLLGYHFGNPVTAQGQRNFIENVIETGKGELAVHVREQFDFGTGTKLDALVKGLYHGVDPEDYERIRVGLNKYNRHTGQSGYIPTEAKAIAEFRYAHDKSDPIELAVNSAADTARRLQQTGELGAVSPYLDRLAENGLLYENGSLTWESAAAKGLNRTAKDAEAQKTLAIIEEMMQSVGERVKAGQIQGDKFMQTYNILSAKRPDLNYFDFLTRNAAPTNAYVWNHTRLNAPSHAGVTYDMLQQLSLRGYHGAAGDIYSRLNFDGDPRMTRQMESFLNGDRNAIKNRISLKDALGGKGIGRLNTAEGRAGTIFDPGHKMAQDNFLLQLPNGTELPVLGHGAYGGKVNRYGLGEFSPNEREKALSGVIRKFEEADRNRFDDEPLQLGADFDKATSAYTGELKKLMYGKEGYLRAEAVDSLGTGKFIQTRASTMRFANGDVNPFEIGVGEDIIKGIQDEGIRKSLMNGEEVYAAVARHPVSHVPLVRVRHDPALNGTNIIGIDEGFRALQMADDDGDMIFSYFFKNGTPGFREAKEAVHNPASLQHTDLAIQQALEGVGDVSRLAESQLQPKGTLARAGEFFGKDLFSALRRRGTSGSTGAFSNTLTQMMIGLEHNNLVTDSAEKAALQRAFFSIRQTPISASKLKAGEGLTFSTALGLNSRLVRSVREGTFDDFYASMESVAKHAPEGVQEFVAGNREMLERYHRGIRPGAMEAARNLTASIENVQLSRLGKTGLAADILPYVQGASREVKELGTGQRMAAEAAGAINQAIRATREVQSSVHGSGAGKVLGIGLAAAAAGGVLFSSLKTPNQAVSPVFEPGSGNAHRPEENIGVSDHIPGEPIPGALAPSRPLRNIVPGSPQVRTAVVAPMRQTADLDVRMRSQDRDRAAETARLMGRATSGSGNPNVTINYRDGSKMGSLRMREKIREQLS